MARLKSPDILLHTNNKIFTLIHITTGFIMKILYTLFFICLPFTLSAYTNNFTPYIGLNIGANIADYTTDIKQNKNYYSGTITAGARISKTFGAELFYTHSTANEVSYVFNYEMLMHEIYLSGYGFDVFAYYNVAPEFDFFTTFGVVNYTQHNKYEYQNPIITDTSTDTDSNVTTRLGIGLMYTTPHDNISLILQYKYTPLNTEFINTLSEFSIGARYNF